MSPGYIGYPEREANAKTQSDSLLFRYVSEAPLSKFHNQGCFIPIRPRKMRLVVAITSGAF
jgi:hypothetical protein